MPEISLNQLAKFSIGTEATKRRIVKQQIKVDKKLVAWYQQAKSSIRKFLKDVSTYEAIEEGLSILRSKHPETKHQKIDQKVSLEALEKIRLVKIPEILSEVEYEFIRPNVNTITVEGVDIKISPDIVIKANFKGKIVYGAIKIHICKGEPFDQNQAQYVATLLHKYLTTIVATREGTVIPELCCCLDVFSDRMVSASETSNRIIEEIKSFCLEIKNIWDMLK